MCTSFLQTICSWKVVKLLYLLDANTLIDANRDYYPLEGVPEFWDWLVYHGEQGNVKIPYEVYDEFLEAKNSDGERDQLAEWASQSFVQDALLLDEDPDLDAIKRVTYGGYMADPTDEDLKKMGQDPFLISYALRDKNNRCIVTSERSKPNAKNANKKVPDVCKVFNIRCVHGFEFFKLLNFSTRFKRS